MGLSCGAQCCKFILFAFNFVFWLAGAAILGVGIWFRVDKNVLSILEIAKVDSSDPLISIASWVLIGIGGFIFLVGFLGCCGACNESPCMLWLYCFFLIIVMLGQITAGVLAAIYRNQLSGEFENKMKDIHMKNYGQSGQDGFTKAWNAVQVSLQCCAVSGPQDYKNTTWFKESGLQSVPYTCCKLKNSDPQNPDAVDATMCQGFAFAPNAPGADTVLNTKGCYSKFLDWLNKHSIIFIAVACSIAAIQIFGIITGCCLIRAIKREEGPY